MLHGIHDQSGRRMQKSACHEQEHQAVLVSFYTTSQFRNVCRWCGHQLTTVVATRLYITESGAEPGCTKRFILWCRSERRPASPVTWKFYARRGSVYKACLFRETWGTASCAAAPRHMRKLQTNPALLSSRPGVDTARF